MSTWQWHRSISIIRITYHLSLPPLPLPHNIYWQLPLTHNIYFTTHHYLTTFIDNYFLQQLESNKQSNKKLQLTLTYKTDKSYNTKQHRPNQITFTPFPQNCKTTSYQQNNYKKTARAKTRHCRRQKSRNLRPALNQPNDDILGDNSSAPSIPGGKEWVKAVPQALPATTALHFNWLSDIRVRDRCPTIGRGHCVTRLSRRTSFTARPWRGSAASQCDLSLGEIWLGFLEFVTKLCAANENFYFRKYVYRSCFLRRWRGVVKFINTLSLFCSCHVFGVS